MQKTTVKHESNGHHSTMTKLGEALRRVNRGTDQIRIGSWTREEYKPYGAASMADVMETIDGVRFLVPDWIPFGMCTMLMAPPGYGKSAFALYGLVRPIITPCQWFSGNGGPKKAGNVLWCDTEGSAAITVQRIKDWGLNPRRIKLPFEDDPLRSVNLADDKDLDIIEGVVNRYKTKLVVVDSLRGSHSSDENNSKIASFLKRVADIAERSKAGVVIIHHTRKIPEGEEITADSSRGSNAILAMVRSQLAIDRPNKDSDCCRLQMLKENLGIKPKAIGFQITSDGLVFGAAPEKAQKETQKTRGVDWLLANMKPGKWYAASEMLDSADHDALSKTNLARAREELGIVKPDNVKKEDGKWFWRIKGRIQ